jgi:hypothetical protein
VLLLIVSQTGLVYTFTTPKLSPVVQQTAGRELIQSCLNAPEPGDHLQSNQDLGNESSEGDQSQDSSLKQEDVSAAPDFTSNLGAHSHQQSHHDPYVAGPFHDPRNAMMSNLTINMPHLQGLSYGNYPGNPMNLHEQGIAYGNYGL